MSGRVGMAPTMATNSESFSVRRAPENAPISTHAAFPAVVVLWFAALLGFGSLMLPVALLERLVAVTGLAALIPSAAPPLGETARAGVALAGAFAGALFGWAVARKVAAGQPRPRRLDVHHERPCRPISAHEELGEEGFGSRIEAPVEPSAPQDDPITYPAHGDEAPAQPVIVGAFDERPTADDRRPLTELGLMQLTVRLSVALAQRKARLTTPPLAGGLDAAEPADAARAMAQFFGSSASAEPADDGSPPMKNPLAPEQEFVRAAKPVNDGDLRPALVPLQRMGGAA